MHAHRGAAMRRLHPARPQRGRTLIEVLVAMTIGLMITAGVISIYGANRQTYRASADVQRMQAAGQLALDRLAYQLRMAGYGQINSADFWLVGNPSNFSGEALRVCSGGFVNPVALPVDATPACNNDPLMPDSLRVAYIVGDPATAGSGANRDCLGVEVPEVGGQREARNRFYIANSNGVPTLMCAGNSAGTGGLVAAPLVPNVADLQIRLRVGDPFSRTEQVVDPQSAAAWTPAQWSRVLGVELCLLVTSESTGLTTDVQAGTDCRGNAFPPDGRLRRTFTQAVTLRNRVL
jgi:type IV pilus assembly protein PilW